MARRANIITDPLAGTVDAGGVEVPINTSFRSGIRALAILEDAALSGAVRRNRIVEAMYGSCAKVSMIGPLFESALRWLGMEVDAEPTGNQKRTVDWDGDARWILADFQAVYGIDLSDPDEDLHWHRFLALFNALPADSHMGRARWCRGVEITSDMRDGEKERIRAMREVYGLEQPDRTDLEAADKAAMGIA